MHLRLASPISQIWMEFGLETTLLRQSTHPSRIFNRSDPAFDPAIQKLLSLLTAEINNLTPSDKHFSAVIK